MATNIQPTGGDDTALVQSVFNTGGYIPAGLFRVRGPIYYKSHTTTTIAGTLWYDRPQPDWPSGYLICGEGYRQNPRPRLGDVNIIFEGDGKIMLPESFPLPANDPRPTYGDMFERKGIGITFTTGFNLINPTVVGENGLNRFALEMRMSSNGHIKGGYLSNRTMYQGADGIHFIDTCRDVLVEGLAVSAGDDSSSQTLELSVASSINSIIERITYKNCSLRSFDHSPLKGLIIDGVGPSSVIRDIFYYNCDMICVPLQQGAGANIFVKNTQANGGGLIDNIQIHGGRIRSSITAPNQLIHSPVLTLSRVNNFQIYGSVIEHFSRNPIIVDNSDDLVFRPSSCTIVTQPPNMYRPYPLVGSVPMVALTDCKRYDIDFSKIELFYENQPMLSSTRSTPK